MLQSRVSIQPRPDRRGVPLAGDVVVEEADEPVWPLDAGLVVGGRNPPGTDRDPSGTGSVAA